MTAHADRAIARYFSGELPAKPERDALFGHLDRCARCRGTFEDHAQSLRLLAGTRELPRAELDLLLPGVLEETAAPERRSFAWAPRLWVPAALTAALAVALAVVTTSGQPRSEDWEAKGGASARSPEVEVLCFDLKGQVVAHLSESGSCPAPGYLKVLYASPVTVPHLRVLAIAQESVRLHAEIASPAPRSVLPDHTRIEPGETIRVIAIATDAPFDLAVAKQQPPTLVVRGQAP